MGGSSGSSKTTAEPTILPSQKSLLEQILIPFLRSQELEGATRESFPGATGEPIFTAQPTEDETASLQALNQLALGGGTSTQSGDFISQFLQSAPSGSTGALEGFLGTTNPLTSFLNSGGQNIDPGALQTFLDGNFSSGSLLQPFLQPQPTGSTAGPLAQFLQPGGVLPQGPGTEALQGLTQGTSPNQITDFLNQLFGQGAQQFQPGGTLTDIAGGAGGQFQPSGALGGVASGEGGQFQVGSGSPLSQFFSADPQEFENFFTEAVQKPLLERFERDILPAITRRGAGTGSLFGGGTRENIQRAQEDLLSELTQQRAITGFQSRESALNRALQAGSTAEQLNLQGFEGARGREFGASTALEQLGLQGFEGARGRELAASQIASQLEAAGFDSARAREIQAAISSGQFGQQDLDRILQASGILAQGEQQALGGQLQAAGQVSAQDFAGGEQAQQRALQAAIESSSLTDAERARQLQAGTTLFGAEFGAGETALQRELEASGQLSQQALTATSQIASQRQQAQETQINTALTQAGLDLDESRLQLETIIRNTIAQGLPRELASDEITRQYTEFLRTQGLEDTRINQILATIGLPTIENISVVQPASTGILGPLAQGIGAAATASVLSSDVRLKEDITPVGKLDNGLTVYRYKFIGQNHYQIGLLAQDVEKVMPEAVGEIAGYKAVNYEMASGEIN